MDFTLILGVAAAAMTLMYEQTEQAKADADKAAADAKEAEHQKKAKEMEAMHVSQELASIEVEKAKQTATSKVVESPMPVVEKTSGAASTHDTKVVAPPEATTAAEQPSIPVAAVEAPRPM